MPFCPTCWHWHEYSHWHAGHRHYGYYGPYSGTYPGATRTDDEIERDIRDSLFWDSWVDATNVRVEVENGVVTLTGTAHSSAEKKVAEDDAWDVPGVVDVRNELRIK
ncbi:MAG: BON domain-containing protein [Chloroflexi bacterium]|nr:BON domain-containing protein [Chloroflexota bacterium]